MGRGLSDLQKCILRLAVEKVGLRENQPCGVDSAAIRRRFYGLEKSTDKGGDAARAAISRTLRRLEMRGLLVLLYWGYYGWTDEPEHDDMQVCGAELTYEGSEVVEKLLATECPMAENVNHDVNRKQ